MSRLESLLRALFFVCVAANLAAAGWFAWALHADRRMLVDLRDAAFSSTAAADLFDTSPERLARAGFRVDPAPLRAEWSERIPRDVPYMRGVAQELDGRGEIEKVKALVPLFSKNGGGGCGDYRDLLHQLLRLPEGDGTGCCSDHVQAFLALAATVGVFPRQVVHHVRHTTAEFWVEALQRWVWVDPQYALLARDPDGRYLSLQELRERYLAGRPVAFEFIGNQFHRFAREEPRQSALYDEPADFASIAVTWGNNVFEEDRLHERLRPLPIVARQALGLAAGVLPGLRFPEPGDGPTATRFARLRARFQAAAALLVLGTLAWPALCLLRRRSR